LPDPSASESYPPAPWPLAGQAQINVFVVPADQLPAVSAGFKPLRIAGRGLVMAGWVDYQEGSVLRYGEVFAAVLGVHDRRPTATVTHMWVDSVASMRGGRELWGYPKELADLDLKLAPAGRAVARFEGHELVRGAFHAWVTSPLRIHLRGTTVQPLDGAPTVVRARIGGRLVLGSGSFDPAPSGPLGFLAKGRLLLSIGLRDFQARFGV